MKMNNDHPGREHGFLIKLWRLCKFKEGILAQTQLVRSAQFLRQRILPDQSYRSLWLQHSTIISASKNYSV